MAEESDGDGDSWLTVGARPRRRTAPSARSCTETAPEDGATRARQSATEPAASRCTGRHDPDWHLVMRSRQALTKLRDEDFALTRLGQIHAADSKKCAMKWRPDPKPASRSRLGARFPMSMSTDRSSRPATALKRTARLVMPRFDLPLASEQDFPRLAAGTARPAAERRRSSVAFKLDESLRSMALQSESTGAPAVVRPARACQHPEPAAAARSINYSEIVTRSRVKAVKKSERRDLVREEIRENVAMLAKKPADPPPPPPPLPADGKCAADVSAAHADEASARRKEKRALKKAKKKECQLILARLNASKDTHVQLVTPHMFQRLHGAHAGRRRAPAEALDLRAHDQYPSLDETVSVQPADDRPTAGQPQQTGVKSYSRMLRELPKTFNQPTENEVTLVETPETKKNTPKKRTPIEISLLDLAEMKAPPRPKRRDGVRGSLYRRQAQLGRLATGNRLDSTPLLRRRGKERLDKKKKKPSLLKRIILRERAERRRRMGVAPSEPTAEQVEGEGQLPAAEGADLQTGAGAEHEGGSGVEQLAISTSAPQASCVSAPGMTVEPTSTISMATQIAAPTAALAPTAAPVTTVEPPSTISIVDPIAASTAVLVPTAAPVTTVEPPSTISMVTQIAAPTAALAPTAAPVTTVEPPSTISIVDPIAASTAALVPTPAPTAAQMTVEPTLMISTAGPIAASSAALVPTPIAAPVTTLETTSMIYNVGPVATSTAAPVPVAVPAVDSDADEDQPPCRGPTYQPSIVVDTKLLIHSCKFREYCQQVLSTDIDDSARLLLQDLTRFQDRLYNRDPIKARSRRRLVIGLREVSKHLAINKLQCVILAPNIEKIQTEGGLDEAVRRLLSLASDRQVPLICALKRRALGHACKKPVPVSCVGVFNYQGSEDNFKRLMQLTEAAQDRYRCMVREVEQALAPQPTSCPASQLLDVFDRISGRQPAGTGPTLATADRPADDPTHALLAKLRSVTLGPSPEVNG